MLYHKVEVRMDLFSYTLDIFPPQPHSEKLEALWWLLSFFSFLHKFTLICLNYSPFTVSDLVKDQFNFLSGYS